MTSVALCLPETNLPVKGDDSNPITRIAEKEMIGEISNYRVNTFFAPDSYNPTQTNARENFANTEYLFPIKDHPIASIPKMRDFTKISNADLIWEGYVIERNKDFFSARLVDTSNQRPDEDVEIKFNRISFDDRHLVLPGAIFYWSIGYERIRGNVQGISIIKFRRLPRWTKSDFKYSQRVMADIIKLLSD